MNPETNEMDLAVYSPAMFREAQTAPKECVGHLLSSIRELYNISPTLISHRNVPSEKPAHHRDLWERSVFVSGTPIQAERQINDHGFDVVLFHNPRTCRQPALLSAKTALVLHGDLSWELPELLPQSRPRIWLWHVAQRLFMPQLDHVFIVSNDLGTRTASRFNIPGKNWSVLYNGVDMDRYHPDAEVVLDKYGVAQPYLLHVSSYARKKNPEGILRAIAELDESDPPLVICGTGWERESVDELIESLDIEDQIIRLGYVPENDLPGLYASAALFLFPSLHETFGIPIVESLACGTPVVTSNIYCMPEIVNEGGLLVNPTEPKNIAEGVSTIIKNRELKAELKNKQNKFISRYSWGRSADLLVWNMSDNRRRGAQLPGLLRVSGDGRR